MTPGLRWSFEPADGVLRLREAGDALDDVLATRGASERARFAARLVAEEVVLNAIEHGGAHAVSMAADLDGGPIRLIFEDDGAPFDPAAHRAESGPPTLRDARPRGRGWVLVRGFTRSIDYRRAEGRNRLSLVLAG